jgi:hypothetical protein
MPGESSPQTTILYVEDLFSFSFPTVYITGCLLFSGTFIKARFIFLFLPYPTNDSKDKF